MRKLAAHLRALRRQIQLPLLDGWLTPAHTHLHLVAFAGVYGLGYGASFTLVQSKAARLFGRRHGFSRLQSFLVVSQYVGSFSGVAITARLREVFGSYLRAFAIFPVLGLVMTAHCVAVRRPRLRR